MKIIGHRGARGLAPENTLSAISHALKHHVDEVEIDVRITKDGAAALNHDAALRINDQTLIIADHSFDDLRKHKPDFTTLADALDQIDTKARPYIEIKPGEAVEPVIAVIREFINSGMYVNTDFLVGSKSQKTLLAFHRVMPDIEKVVIESWSGVRAHFRAKQVNTRRLSMRSWWLWRGFLKSMHRRGYQIAPYTMNDPAKVRKWQKYLYGVVTDFPDRFETKSEAKE